MDRLWTAIVALSSFSVGETTHNEGVTEPIQPSRQALTPTRHDSGAHAACTRARQASGSSGLHGCGTGRGGPLRSSHRGNRRRSTGLNAAGSTLPDRARGRLPHCGPRTRHIDACCGVVRAPRLGGWSTHGWCSRCWCSRQGYQFNPGGLASRYAGLITGSV